jgi:hypothetical protein
MRCQTQRQCYQRGWGSYDKSWRSLAIWMSWFPWILGMLILLLCWVKLSHFGVLRILAGFVPSAFRNTLVSDREQYPMPSVYGNKIVVGYEDAMRTITQEMVVMSVQKQLELSSKSQKKLNPNFKVGFGILNNRIFIF